jgi:hypothetical protein
MALSIAACPPKDALSALAELRAGDGQHAATLLTELATRA